MINAKPLEAQRQLFVFYLSINLFLLVCFYFNLLFYIDINLIIKELNLEKIFLFT
jgi:hypothetical protein